MFVRSLNNVLCWGSRGQHFFFFDLLFLLIVCFWILWPFLACDVNIQCFAENMYVYIHIDLLIAEISYDDDMIDDYWLEYSGSVMHWYAIAFYVMYSYIFCGPYVWNVGHPRYIHFRCERRRLRESFWHIWEASCAAAYRETITLSLALSLYPLSWMWCVVWALPAG